MSKSVFVTGATGSVGVPIVKAFVAAGYRVVGMTRSEESAAKLRALGAEPFMATLDDADKIKAEAAKHDGAIHAGADTSQGAEVFVRGDHAATSAILEAFKGTNKRFVYTSGCWIYGDRQGEINNDTAVTQEQSFPYGKNHRIAFNQEVVEKAAAYGVHAVLLHLCNVTSPSTGFGKVVLWVSSTHKNIRYWGNGENHISLIHQDDVGEGYLRAYENGKAGAGYILNGAVVKFKDFAAGAKAILGDQPVESLPVEEVEKMVGFYALAATINQEASTKQTAEAIGFVPKKTSVADLWTPFA